MNRIERLTAILLFLQDQPHTAQEIADHFEVSRRTILRDVQALSEMGVPVIAREGSGGGYALPEDYTLAPLALSAREGFLLLLALNSINQPGHMLFHHARASLMTKLRALLPRGDLASLDQMLAKINIEVAGHGKPAPLLDDLADAVEKRRWLKVIYQSAGETNTRHLLPVQVLLKNGFWYCEAFTLEKEEYRTYRVDRIQSIQSAPPEVQALTAPDPVPYEHKDHPEIRVLLTARGAARLESDLHFGPRVQGLADGGEVSFRCPPGELDWYAGFFTGLGEDVTVLAPELLRQKMQRLGRQLVNRYTKQ
jgi:predicted DNA-binding transcriptional regulator YafY